MEDSLNQTVPAEEETNNTTILVIAEDEEEDPFNRLPDEIIISHILDKVSEAKSLFRFSLVSKNFSSLVYQTKTVTFKIPLEKTPDDQLSPSLPGKVFHFITTPLRWFIHGFFHSIMKKRSRASLVDFEVKYVFHLITKFLAKFSSLKSLHMEFNLSGLNFHIEPVVKWKMVCHSKDGSFILLIAKSLDLAAAVDVDVDADNDSISANEMELLQMHLDFHMSLANYRFSVMEKLVPLLPESLENIVVTDSKNQGVLYLGGTDLLEMRNGITNSEHDGEAKIRFWQEPFLKMPLSGSVMKMVDLFVIKDTESEMDDCLMVKEAFDGEEDVFAEAVMEMMKKEVISEEIVRVQDL